MTKPIAIESSKIAHSATLSAAKEGGGDLSYLCFIIRGEAHNMIQIIKPYSNIQNTGKLYSTDI